MKKRRNSVYNNTFLEEFDYNKLFTKDSYSLELSTFISLGGLKLTLGWNDKLISIFSDTFDDFYDEFQLKIKNETVKKFVIDYKNVLHTAYFGFWASLVQSVIIKYTDSELGFGSEANFDPETEQLFITEIKLHLELFFIFVSRFYLILSGDIKELEKLRKRLSEEENKRRIYKKEFIEKIHNLYTTSIPKITQQQAVIYANRELNLFNEDDLLLPNSTGDSLPQQLLIDIVNSYKTQKKNL